MEFIFELLIQIVVEGIYWWALGASPRSNRDNPFYIGSGHFILGAVLGAFSLFVLPKPLITQPWLQTVNLIAAPIVCGALVALYEHERKKRDSLNIEFAFYYGFLFAFAMVLVRYVVHRLNIIDTVFQGTV